MPIETHVDHARSRVTAEQEATAAKRTGLEAFRDRLADVPTVDGGESGTRAGAGAIASGGVQSLSGGTASRDGCEAVRRAFAETVLPHCEDADGCLGAVREELTDTIALALAPNSPATLTPTLRRSIDAEAAVRGRELSLLADGLEREAASIDAAASVVEAVTDWLVAADERPLRDLGFDALRERHERLAAHRERCEDVAADRQALLDDVSSDSGDVALCHRALVAECYADFPVDHPVLATVARLDETLADCQRAVRDHLVRRV